MSKRKTALAGVVGLLILLPGCLWFARNASISGTVRIESASSTTVASMSLGSVSSASIGSLSAGSIKRIPLRTSTGYRERGARSTQYMVQLNEDLAERDAREIARKLDLVYLRSGPRGAYVLEDRQGRKKERVLAQLKSIAAVASAQVNLRVVPLGAATDPYYPSQWALEHIRAPGAWDVTTGSDAVTVAIVDSGIDFNHPELKDPSRWAVGRDFTDGTVSGTDYRYDPNDRDRAGEHGTMVAGIIGALTNNGEGISGVAWQVRLMPLRVFGGADTGEDIVANAILWAVDHGADVINLSLGTECDVTGCPPPGDLLAQALEYAWSKNVVVVAAAGNSGVDVVAPANYWTTIAVGATDRSKMRAGYSNYGTELDLMAPGGSGDSGSFVFGCGDDIIAPIPYGDYGCAAGTSFAAPHVSAVVALMLARGVARTPDDLLHLLEITAEDLGDEGWDPQTGYGLINAQAAVSAGPPQLFAASKGASRLAVQSPIVTAGSGGRYLITGVPEGTWTVVGWVDVDGSGTVNNGDYYGEYPSPVLVRAGRSVTLSEFAISPYTDNEELAVD